MLLKRIGKLPPLGTKGCLVYIRFVEDDAVLETIQECRDSAAKRRRPYNYPRIIVAFHRDTSCHALNR